MSEGATISEATRFQWPVVATLVGCTFWISTSIAEIKTTTVGQSEIVQAHEIRLKALERISIERGPLLDALLEEMRKR